MITREEKNMNIALKEALKSYEKYEVPVGVIIVKDDKIIARAHNTREKTKLATDHAELNAINKACKKLGTWRLDDTEMYVTLEPCLMCAGAILQSRIKTVYYGASDLKAGAVESVLKVAEADFCHKVNYIGGIKNEECKELLQKFFKEMRANKKNDKKLNKSCN